MSAVGDSEVISQEAPTDWIRPPKLEHRLASQSARKMLYLNGVRGEARAVSGRRGGESFMADKNVAPSGGRRHGRIVVFGDESPNCCIGSRERKQLTPSPLAGEGDAFGGRDWRAERSALVHAFGDFADQRR